MGAKILVSIGAIAHSYVGRRGQEACSPRILDSLKLVIESLNLDFVIMTQTGETPS